MRLCALLLFVPAVASAQPQDRIARTHFESGRSYYDQGRYAEALHEFQEAYRLASPDRKPIMLYNIGQTQERLGRLPEAIAALRQYLDENPDADDRPQVETRIENLQVRVDATRIALRANEDGASVLVDGAAVGTTPLAEAIRVTPGAHELRVEKEGFRAFSLRVTVPVGEEVAAEATLVSEAAPASGQPATAAPAASEGPRLYTWVAAGVAGAAAIAGGAFGFLALGRRDDANAEATGDRPTYDDARSSAETFALVADVSFGVAVVAAGTAIVLFTVEPGWGEDAQAAVAPVLRADGGGVSFAGRF